MVYIYYKASFTARDENAQNSGKNKKTTCFIYEKSFFNKSEYEVFSLVVGVIVKRVAIC